MSLLINDDPDPGAPFFEKVDELELSESNLPTKVLESMKQPTVSSDQTSDVLAVSEVFVTEDLVHNSDLIETAPALSTAARVHSFSVLPDELDSSSSEASVETINIELDTECFQSCLIKKMRSGEFSETDCLEWVRGINQKELKGVLDFFSPSPEDIKQPNRYALLIRKMQDSNIVTEHIKDTLAELEGLRNALSGENCSQEFMENLSAEINVTKELLKQAELMGSESGVKSLIRSLATDGITHFYINTINSSALHSHIGGFDPYLQIVYLIDDIDAFLVENPHLSESQKNALEQFKENLVVAKDLRKLDVGHSSYELSEKEEEEESVENRMHQQIEQLSVGGACIFSGEGKGHTFVYEIIRISESEYSFTVINTGEDESEFKIWKDRTPNLIYKASHKIPISAYEHLSYRMPLDVLSPAFLKSIAPSTTRQIPTPKVIQRIRRDFEGQNDVVRCSGRLHKPQKAENCSAKALKSAMVGQFLRNLGKEEAMELFLQFKKFKGERDYMALEELLEITPPAILKEIFKARTDRELDKELKSTHRKAQSVLARWDHKYFDIIRSKAS